MIEIDPQNAKLVCTLCGFEMAYLGSDIPQFHTNPFLPAKHSASICTFKLVPYAKKQTSAISNELKNANALLEDAESRLESEKALAKSTSATINAILKSYDKRNDPVFQNALTIARDRAMDIHKENIETIASEIVQITDSTKEQKSFFETYAPIIERFDITKQTLSLRSKDPKLAFLTDKSCSIRHYPTDEELSREYTCNQCNKPIHLIGSTRSDSPPTIEAHFTMDEDEKECFNSRATLSWDEMHRVSDGCRPGKVDLHRIREVNDGEIQ